MVSRNQSDSTSLPQATRREASTAVPSDAPSAASSSDGYDASAPTETRAASASRTLASWMRHESRYRIEYSQTGDCRDYRFRKLDFESDRGPSHMKAHDQAIVKLVEDLNIGHSHDRGAPEKDVGPMIDKCNDKDQKTHFTMFDAGKCGESDPEWSASISIVSGTGIHRMAKNVVGSIKTGKAASLLTMLRKPRGYDIL